MHRNTTLVIATLAITVTLLMGIQIGRKLSTQPTSLPSPSIMIIASPSPVVEQRTLTHSDCGIRFEYPSVFTIKETSESAQLTRTETDEMINVICGVDFPKPPLTKDRIEEATVAGQRATVYHDASAKDGTPLDVVVFNHPKKKHEVALFGFGELFNRLVGSLTLLQ